VSPAQDWVLFFSRAIEKPLEIVEVVPLRADADMSAVTAALYRLFDQADALRMEIRRGRGGFVQRPVPLQPSEAITQAQLSPDAATHAPLKVDRLCPPLDLEAGISATAAVVDGSAERFLAFKFHHAVTDWWSMGLLRAQLSQHYADVVRGHTSVASAKSFAEIAESEWNWANSFEGRQSVEFWVASLEDAPFLVQAMACANEDGGVAQAQSISRSSNELGRAFRQLVRTERCLATSVTTLAFALVVAATSGQRDGVVASELANRRHSDSLGVLGSFANTVFLRLTVKDSATVRDLLRSYQDRVISQLINQGASARAVLRRWGPKLPPAGFGNFLLETRQQIGDPHGGEHPLFAPARTGFEVPALAVAGLRLIIDVSEKVVVRVEFDAREFDATFASELAARYLRALDLLMANLDARVGTILTMLRDGAEPSPSAATEK
jgi:hypothetical protein